MMRAELTWSSSVDVDTCGLQKGAACLVCYEREGNNVLMPCGHGGYCLPCSRRILDHPDPGRRVCPVCRTFIQSAVRVYLSTPVGAEAVVLEAALPQSLMSTELDSEYSMHSIMQNGSEHMVQSVDSFPRHYLPRF
jgi:Zinc finger, C3HC4 type (RING finger)